jgi:signal transduction histidine kinase
LAFDVAVAVFVCTFDAWQLLDPSSGVGVSREVMGAVVLASVSIPLLWRRRRPLRVLAVVTTVNLAWFMLPYVATRPFEHFNAGFVAFLVSLYGAGLYSTSRKAALAAAVAALAALLPAAALQDEQFRSNPRVFLMNASFVAISFYVGYIGRVQRDYLEERAARMEHERRAAIRRAAATERARIARELHDVVAHSVGLMTVQAGAANLVADNDPHAALSTLSAIERTGRQALAELRRLLGVLRTDGDDGGALSPQPDLDRLDELVTKVRQAGVVVNVTIDGDLEDLPTTLGVSAYRILQEALTNVIKHAGPHAQAEVLVQRTGDQLVLNVSDDGPGAASPGASMPGGNGLIGMRERVALFGGRMTTGPRDDSGFLVRVEIPLEHGQR